MAKAVFLYRQVGDSGRPNRGSIKARGLHER